MTDGVLFVHAFPLDARMWQEQQSPLAGAVPVAAVNLPGFAGTSLAGDMSRVIPYRPSSGRTRGCTSRITRARSHGSWATDDRDSKPRIRVITSAARSPSSATAAKAARTLSRSGRSASSQ